MKRTNDTYYLPGCFFKFLFAFPLFLFSSGQGMSQTVSGTWDAASNTGSSGYTNWGSGVITLTDTTSGSGTCQGGAVLETSTTYSTSSASNFSQCYNVFFGCPGNDNIGADANGDGMAFSFWKSTTTFNENNGLACGGGLGYMGAVASPGTAGSMITIEFDTYGSQCNSNFDCSFGGNVAPSTNDEISVHINGDASDAGLLAGSSVNAGNLEDGNYHTVCITYNPTTRFLTVTIDAITRLNIDLGGTYNFASYFGAGVNLNQSWSAGKYGANNYQTIGPSGYNLFAYMGRNPCTGVVMPVKLISFIGASSNEGVVLNWVTASEESSATFIIERSENLFDWTAVGEVAAQGNSDKPQHYTFTDESSLSVAYYRLRQTDVDGSFAYSNIIEVQPLESELMIAPNPFESGLSVCTNSKDEVEISISDMSGRNLFYSNQKAENGRVTIQPELVSGVYIVSVKTEHNIKQKRLIRK